MRKACQCTVNRNCEIWTDYQVALLSLEEAEELSHLNWIEIQHLHDRVCQLEKYIRDQGLPLPEEPY